MKIRAGIARSVDINFTDHEKLKKRIERCINSGHTKFHWNVYLDKFKINHFEKRLGVHLERVEDEY